MLIVFRTPSIMTGLDDDVQIMNEIDRAEMEQMKVT